MKKIRLIPALLTCCLWLSPPAFALTPDAPLADATLEKRALNLFHEIRCVVCESEAISDSPAAIARDMRRMVRAEIAAGKSDEAIMEQLEMTYGERVLMMPHVSPANSLLWFGPLLVLGVGALVAWSQLFRKKRP